MVKTYPRRPGFPAHAGMRRIIVRGKSMACACANAKRVSRVSTRVACPAPCMKAKVLYTVCRKKRIMPPNLRVGLVRSAPNRPFYAGSTLGGNLLDVYESKSYKEIRIHFSGRSYVHWYHHHMGDYTSYFRGLRRPCSFPVEQPADYECHHCTACCLLCPGTSTLRWEDLAQHWK